MISLKKALIFILNIWIYLPVGRYIHLEKFSSLDYNFTSSHSILFSDPENESYGSGGSNAPLKSRIGSVVAEISHDTFRWMLSNLDFEHQNINIIGSMNLKAFFKLRRKCCRNLCVHYALRQCVQTGVFSPDQCFFTF